MSEKSRQLTVALAQFAPRPQEFSENLRRGELMIEQAAAAGAELIIFPEMWTTGLDYIRNQSILEAHEAVHDKLAARAQREGVWLTGSLLSKNDQGLPHNTAFLFSPDGAVHAHYTKTHLFTLMHEERYLTPGNEVVVADLPSGRIGFTICYDIRFPELWRKLAVMGAELILCPAGIPEPRRDHWRTLLKARAIENQCFVAGVNLCGQFDLGFGPSLSYFGSSMLYDPWGRIRMDGGYAEDVSCVTIDLEESLQTRSRMAVLQDRRPELYGEPGAQ